MLGSPQIGPVRTGLVSWTGFENGQKIKAAVPKITQGPKRRDGPQPPFRSGTASGWLSRRQHDLLWAHLSGLALGHTCFLPVTGQPYPPSNQIPQQPPRMKVASTKAAGGLWLRMRAEVLVRTGHSQRPTSHGSKQTVKPKLPANPPWTRQTPRALTFSNRQPELQ